MIGGEKFKRKWVLGRARGIKILLNFVVDARTPLRQERTHHTYTSRQVEEPWWPRVRTDGLRPANSNRPHVSRLVRQHAPGPALYAPPSSPAGKMPRDSGVNVIDSNGEGKGCGTPARPIFSIRRFSMGKFFWTAQKWFREPSRVFFGYSINNRGSEKCFQVRRTPNPSKQVITDHRCAFSTLHARESCIQILILSCIYSSCFVLLLRDYLANFSHFVSHLHFHFAPFYRKFNK